MYDILELNKKLVAELREIAKELNIRRIESFKKQDLIYKILDTQAVQEAEKKERKYAPKEQIKEIIKGFNREKNPDQHHQQLSQYEKTLVQDEIKPRIEIQKQPQDQSH